MGKTTCAAARAIAEARNGRRALIVSTDPAHSLSDALAVNVTSRPTRVATGGRGALDAVELDAVRAFDRWLTEHRTALGQILEHGTWLDQDDVDALLELSLPGVDELAAMLEIARLTRSADAARHARGGRKVEDERPYDVVVVDTAPTGHTLRLLAAPDVVAAVAEVLDALQEEHRMIRDQLARVGRPEAADRLIAMLAEQAADAGAAMRDASRTMFHWVTLPEALAIAESEDGVAALERHRIAVPEIIVNRVLPDDRQRPPCPVCSRRRADQRRAIATIHRCFARGRRVLIVPADVREPRGVRALARIGASLGRDRTRLDARDRAPSRARAQGAPSVAFSLSAEEQTTAVESLSILRDATLVFVGGKGGVGKTTVAAATAVRLARARPKARTLLLSTDPAHSLADVLNAADGTIGDEARTLSGAPSNLLVRELDAALALGSRRRDFQQAIEEIASTLGAAETSAAERSARLLDLAPPGIDELFGMLSLVEARRQFDLIVVDTAPTGHALRLLELPDSAREWVQVLLRMLLKYRTLVRPGQLASELVDASKSIRELQALLRDPIATRFLVVTRASEVPRLETERLLDRLRRLRLSVAAVVINARTLAPGRCRRCRKVAAAERRPVAAIRRRCRSGRRSCAIIETPLSAPGPRGVSALEAWAAKWIAKES